MRKRGKRRDKKKRRGRSKRNRSTVHCLYTKTPSIKRPTGRERWTYASGLRKYPSFSSSTVFVFHFALYLVYFLSYILYFLLLKVIQFLVFRSAVASL